MVGPGRLLSIPFLLPHHPNISEVLYDHMYTIFLGKIKYSQQIFSEWAWNVFAISAIAGKLRTNVEYYARGEEGQCLCDLKKLAIIVLSWLLSHLRGTPIQKKSKPNKLKIKKLIRG